MTGSPQPERAPEQGDRIDIAFLGETMGQFVPEDGGVLDATSFRLHHAGAESNVAVGVARLGLRAAWVSRVGRDAVGERILRGLASEGVVTSLVERDDRHPTGIFLKDPAGDGRAVTYYRAGSAASRMDRSDVERALSTHPRVLHVSGITSALSSTCDDAVGHALTRARGQNVTTSFDVNYRPALWTDREIAARRLAELARASDVVFVGQDEALGLWGTATPEAVARHLGGAGCVVVKDGAHAATSVTAEGVVRVPALRVDVTESVGAGDAFAAGWLAAMLLGKGDVVRLRAGHLMARAALSSRTDQGDRIALPDLLSATAEESLWIPRSDDPTTGENGTHAR